MASVAEIHWEWSPENRNFLTRSREWSSAALLGPTNRIGDRILSAMFDQVWRTLSDDLRSRAVRGEL